MHGLCREGKNHQGVTDKTAQARIMRAMPHRWKPNVTVAAIVEHEGRFLLVEEETADGLRLNNPAGHLDPGNRPWMRASAKCWKKRPTTLNPGPGRRVPQPLHTHTHGR